MQDANKRSTIQLCFIRPKTEQSSAIGCLLKRNANQLKLNCARTLILAFAEPASDGRPQLPISLIGNWPTTWRSRASLGMRKHGTFPQAGNTARGDPCEKQSSVKNTSAPVHSARGGD